MDDFGDIPIGLTGFDSWMTKVLCILIVKKLIECDLDAMHKVDREHWRTYYDFGYTPEEAFEEDITYYGD